MERQRRLISMPVISEVLFPDDVNLALAATTKQDAIEEVLAKLNGDPRVSDWEALRTAVLKRDAPSIAVNGMGICIAHGRLNSVKSSFSPQAAPPQGWPARRLPSRSGWCSWRESRQLSIQSISALWGRSCGFAGIGTSWSASWLPGRPIISVELLDAGEAKL